jgi:O-antigen/teichoic acid export membrane protein
MEAIRGIRREAGDASTAEGRSRERYRRAMITAASSYAARAVSLATSLITIPLTLKYLGSERYGLWMVLTSIIGVMGFADLGIGNGLMNAVAEADGRDDRKLAGEYVSSGFFLLLLVSAGLALLGGVAYPLIPWPRVFNVSSPIVAAEGAKAFAVLFGWLLLNIPLGVVTRIQFGLQRGYVSQSVAACGSLISLAGVLIAIYLKAGLPLLVFSSTAGSIVAFLLNGLLLSRSHPWLMPKRRLARMRSASKLFRLGLLFFVLQTAAAIGFNTDNIVIAQLLGAVAVTGYAVPQKLFNYVSLFLMFGLVPLWPAYSEAIARGDFDWAKRTLRRSMVTSFTIAAVLNLFLVVAGPLILRHWVGNSVQPSRSLLWLLGVWGVIAAISAPMSVFIKGSAGVLLKFQAAMAVVMAGMNIALSIFFTRRVGIPGVVLGSVISQTAAVLIPTLFLLRRHLRHMEGTLAQPLAVPVAEIAPGGPE